MVVILFSGVLVPIPDARANDTIKIGLNYPRTGPYYALGDNQHRAAVIAINEINADGGIHGRPIELVCADTRSDAERARANAVDMIDNHGVEMIFGGASSAVAIAVGEVCQQKGVPFMGTLTYSTATTGVAGHRHTFRECYDSWMAAKALAAYLNGSFQGKKYYYIAADYTWGWTTQEAVRRFTHTTDEAVHPGVFTPLGTIDFTRQLSLVQLVKPDVLVLVLGGEDMVNVLWQASEMGITDSVQIVVPNLTLGMAEGAGPEVMQGVVGTVSWCWRVPYKYNYRQGKEFVETFVKHHDRYPSSSAASAYTILWEYRDAVERAESFDAADVIRELEGHHYRRLKDEQYWRDFDHQSVQTVYIVRCHPPEHVRAHEHQADYFEILGTLSGEKAVITREEWEATRLKNNLPPHLEPLESIAGQ
ncbi:ABC transporter substrate-binding protein [candidate division GN15 bacterium]|nr:ABC transporter substrate-binding protein [candidate division GN15 bacterium]